MFPLGIPEIMLFGHKEKYQIYNVQYKSEQKATSFVSARLLLLF